MSGRDGPPPGYIEVSERWAKARADYPDARLQGSYEIVQIGEQWFVAYTARAYRSPDDTMPGIGVAFEPVPGKTSFTRDSEAMNAETSAWGRALVAAGMADAKEGIASANEVRGRPHPGAEGDGEAPSAPVRQHPPPAPGDVKAFRARVRELAERHGMDPDALRHKMVGYVTGGRTESSAELSRAELVDAWAQYREALRQIEGAQTGGQQEGGSQDDGR